MSENVVNSSYNSNIDDKYFLVTSIIVLLIPTIAKIQSSYGSMVEMLYYFPWMLLIRFTPNSDFNSDQYTIISFPWSFIIFIPFFYVIYLSYQLRNPGEDKMEKAIYVILASLIQIIVIYVTFLSQYISVQEERSVYYIPELLIIFIYLYRVYVWFIEETKPNKNL
ncbi:MAG: hypothetical protein OEY49_02495 [Candidatus Heimdallarchaeota archaeon]|nr:hypothetical protein [Candidatus Heimdallarchaeota archaeon]